MGSRITPDFPQEFADYWAVGFDWRSDESVLDRFDQFVAEIDGQTIRFLHVRSPELNAVPLLLNHSHPTSFVELRQAGRLLADSAFSRRGSHRCLPCRCCLAAGFRLLQPALSPLLESG